MGIAASPGPPCASIRPVGLAVHECDHLWYSKVGNGRGSMELKKRRPCYQLPELPLWESVPVSGDSVSSSF